MQMPRLKADSSVPRRIVEAFVGFLSNVEPALGADPGGLEVARECLRDVFKLDSSSTNSSVGLELMDYFESLQPTEQRENREEGSSSSRVVLVDVPWRLYAHIKQKAYPEQGEDSTEKPVDNGLLRQELCQRFRHSLENQDHVAINYDMLHDVLPPEKANQIVEKTTADMMNAGCQKVHNENTAETLKSKGNKAMESMRYNAAIDLYTVATALSSNNPIYYCNRAAAYTLINKYDEAIEDCLRAVKLDPTYWKAYSRLGTAYYALGKYHNAIEEGYRKALELNPHNASIKEKIQAAEQKLEDELLQREDQVNPNSSEGPDVDQSAADGSKLSQSAHG
ncbi:small glutamine-rich tetratricopeptide repeat-containing protein beta-like isoform X2 [Punica granatum]|uniref:Small glutamine-rich tetratricopeptide repeat-containing protein beta-like isoform X2 n=1 Tax=Punica granatum TaxID=22663 RepID=A0A6P8DAR5_PUNGR|nr:small glutamine-rich tetratricopeptide repeat-containing protein beta-like isoform X2 [Punica granatum]